MSFLPGIVAEVRSANDDFVDAFNDMKNELSVKGFRIETLYGILRTSKQIAGAWQMTEGKYSIEKNATVFPNSIAPAILGYLPTEFSLYYLNLDLVQELLAQAKGIIERKDDQNFVVLIDDYLEEMIPIETVENDLTQVIGDMTLLVYDGLMDSVTNDEIIIKMSRRKDAILLTKASLFSGIQTPNVIYFVAADVTPKWSFLLATNRVIIINVFQNYDYTQLHGALTKQDFSRLV